MTLKRTLAKALALALTLGVLAGCSGNNPSSSAAGACAAGRHSAVTSGQHSRAERGGKDQRKKMISFHVYSSQFTGHFDGKTF